MCLGRGRSLRNFFIRRCWRDSTETQKSFFESVANVLLLLFFSKRSTIEVILSYLTFDLISNIKWQAQSLGCSLDWNPVREKLSSLLNAQFTYQSLKWLVVFVWFFVVPGNRWPRSSLCWRPSALSWIRSGRSSLKTVSPTPCEAPLQQVDWHIQSHLQLIRISRGQSHQEQCGVKGPKSYSFSRVP